MSTDHLIETHESPRPGVFRIHSAVSNFRRLINTVGTPNDDLQFRQRIQNTRLQIGRLVKETSTKLKQVTDNNHDNKNQNNPQAPVLKAFFQVQPAEEISNANLLTAAERYTAPNHPLSLSLNNNSVEQINFKQSSTRQENKQDLRDDEQIVIVEREQSVKDVQEQMNEVNEIFRDLAELVHEQGFAIDGISSDTENCNAAITQTTSELAKAVSSRHHSSDSSESSMTCLLLVIFGLVLLIVVILLAAN